MVSDARVSQSKGAGRFSMPEMMEPLFQQPSTSTHSCVDVSYGEALQGLCLGFSPRLTNVGALFKFGESNFVQAICESSLITEIFAEAGWIIIDLPLFKDRTSLSASESPYILQVRLPRPCHTHILASTANVCVTVFLAVFTHTSLNDDNVQANAQL